MIYSNARNDSLVQFVTVSSIDKIVLKKNDSFSEKSFIAKYRPVNIDIQIII